EGRAPAQKRDRPRRPLVVEHLDVGQSAEVVDRDVAELPAHGPPHRTARPESWVVVPAASHAVARAPLDPAELLDVDMEELARARALVADDPFLVQPREPSQPDA